MSGKPGVADLEDGLGPLPLQCMVASVCSCIFLTSD